ncbi:hypothetical protein Bca52824_011545 [Brassica carinata]|uniref:Uncharacterized protein n=1 Tax=Brassica carinata TaxID=52824 RepID=A0A8X7WGF8_BRACI|nr:hypothetical protein Bca52824_011545 [Brassica carinata]
MEIRLNNQQQGRELQKNQTLILSEQQLDDLAAEIFNQIMRSVAASKESLYHMPSMVQARVSREEKFKADFFTLQTDLSWLVDKCGKTRDDPIEERDGPRLKSEYGDQCTRPPDQENHVRRFTLILDQVVLR